MTFDLERARGLRDFLQDDCAEVGDIWGEMIAEIERLRAENEEALESLTAAYLLGRHEKAQEVAARPKEGKIDSSEHVTEPTKMIGFDLEKARAADEALPYPLDAKEIWISGKGQMHINPPNAQSIFFNLSDLCEVRNLFHGQAAEIEWLNEHINTACLESLRITDEQAKEIERLRALPVADVAAYDHRIQEMAARIAELEKWLKKERSARLLENSPGVRIAYLKENEIDFDKFFDGKALEQLQAEGKIGSSDHSSDVTKKVWQITEERKAAIWHAVAVLKENDPDDEHLWDEEIAVLRAMLREAA